MVTVHLRLSTRRRLFKNKSLEKVKMYLLSPLQMPKKTTRISFWSSANLAEQFKDSTGAENVNRRIHLTDLLLSRELELVKSTQLPSLATSVHL